MPRPLTRALGALATLVVSLVPSLASAQLTGHTLGAQWLSPDLATIVQTRPPAVVGPGIEFTLVAQAEGDFSDAQLLFRGIPGTGPIAWLPATFSGPRFYDVGGTVPDFVSVTLNPATNLPGFDLSRVTWNADEVFLNVQGLVQLPGEVVVLDFEFAAVPEPATVALTAGGLLGVLAIARRRRTR